MRDHLPRSPVLPLEAPALSASLRAIAAAGVLALLAGGCIVAEGDKQGEGAAESTAFNGDDLPDDDDPMDDGGEGDGTEGDDEEQPLITLEWGVNGFEITVDGAPPGLWLGMVETGGPCVATGSCWTGEDCRSGYTSGDQTFGPYCHPLLDNAPTVLLYDGDPASLGDGMTAFEPQAEGNTTYLLESRVEDGGDGSCWVFGQDPTYYSSEGCAFASF